MNRKTLLGVSVPVCGMALLALLAVLRGRPAAAGPVRPPSASSQAPASSAPRSPELVRALPPEAPKPAPEKTVASAMDEARLKTTYQNYRTSLAVGNQPQSDALYLVLVRERALAVKLAEADLAQAQEALDRSLAQKALETLRR